MILKSNIPSSNELLINKFSPHKQEIIEKIKALDSQIESLRIKYNNIKDYHDDYFVSLRKETFCKIANLLKNSVFPKTPSERSKEINKLRALPDDFDDVGNIDFKSIFSKALIADKGLIYFVIGDRELVSPPLHPELFLNHQSNIRLQKLKFIFNLEY